MPTVSTFILSFLKNKKCKFITFFLFNTKDINICILLQKIFSYIPLAFLQAINARIPWAFFSKLWQMEETNNFVLIAYSCIQNNPKNLSLGCSDATLLSSKNWSNFLCTIFKKYFLYAKTENSSSHFRIFFGKLAAIPTWELHFVYILHWLWLLFKW